MNQKSTFILIFSIGFVLNSCKKEEPATIPILSTSPVNNITAITAVSGGSITSDGDSKITASGVCWSTGANPTTLDTKTTENVKAGQFVSNLTGLSAGTTYHVRAFATNSVGTAYGSDLSFTTLGQSPSAVTLSASSVTTTGVTLNGTVNPNELSTTITFEYGTTTSYGLLVNAGQSPVTGNSNVNVSADVSGLTIGTTYHFRIKAVNLMGTTYGSDMTFSTSGQAPTCQTLQASNVSGTTATLNGTVNPNSLSTEVVFEYGTTTAYGTTVSASQGPVNGNAGTNIDADLTNLVLGTTYHFRVKATNSLGTVYGNDMSFSTYKIPTLTTTPPLAASITRSTATSGGNITSDGGSEIISRGVCWNTTGNPTAELSTKTVDDNGIGVYESSITGLSPNTRYFIRAYAINDYGTAYGNQVEFTTNPITGANITTTAPTIIAATTANPGGNITYDGGASVSERGIVWATTSNPTTSNNKVAASSAGIGTFTVSLSQLQSGTLYHIRAYAISTFGTSYGDDISFTTLPSIPNVTTNTVSAFTQSSATVGGNIISTGGADVTERGVYFGTQTTPTTTGNKVTASNGGTGSFSINLSGLAANTVYYVVAYATNSAGTAFGNEVTFTTVPTDQASVTTNPPELILTNASTVTAGGNVTSDGGGFVTDRGICWGTSSNPTVSGSHFTSGSGTGLFSVTLTQLQEGTIYFVRAYAINEAGTAYGSEYQFLTMVSDADNNIYRTVKIGDQIWIAENLKTTKYNDNSGIPNVTDDAAWATLTNDAYSWYGNDNALQQPYGALYNWYAVNTGKLCPAEWHVPTDLEWTNLVTLLGGETIAGGVLKETGTTHWVAPNIGATNETGFTAVPGGYRSYGNGVFAHLGFDNYLWSSTERNDSEAFYMYIINSSSSVYKENHSKTFGLSVRCVKD